MPTASLAASCPAFCPTQGIPLTPGTTLGLWGVGGGCLTGAPEGKSTSLGSLVLLPMQPPPTCPSPSPPIEKAESRAGRGLHILLGIGQKQRLEAEQPSS